MPLVLNADPVRIELTTPGEWVEVKPRLSKGDLSKISAASFKLQMKVRDARDLSGDVDVDFDATIFAGLEVGMVGWSFGEPLTPENIRALDPDDYDLIVGRVNELWAPRSDDDRKNSFATSPAPSSRDTATSLLSSVG